MHIGKRKAVAIAVMLAIALIACVAGWLAPSYTWDGGRAVLGFIGRRLETAVTGQRLEIGLLVAAALALEIMLMGWRNSSVFRLLFARRKSANIDAIVFGILMVGLTDAVTIILTFGISVETGRAVSWILSQYGWPRIALPSEGALPLAAGVAIYWLLTTFFAYWAHRLMHTPQFWPLHRFHHAATELNMITGFRQHSVEPVVLNLLSVVSPLLFFKASDSILFIYLLVGTTADLLAHSHLPWTMDGLDPGSFIRRGFTKCITRPKTSIVICISAFVRYGIICSVPGTRARKHLAFTACRTINTRIAR